MSLLTPCFASRTYSAQPDYHLKALKVTSKLSYPTNFCLVTLVMDKGLYPLVQGHQFFFQYLFLVNQLTGKKSSSASQLGKIHEGGQGISLLLRLWHQPLLSGGIAKIQLFQ